MVKLKSVGLGLVLALVTGVAQAAQVPDLSGFWELRGELPVVPPGKVLPAAKQHLQDIIKSRGVASPEVRWCKPIGVPFFYGMSPPIDIAQDKREVVVMGETLSAPQHIYLDRTAFPDAESFEFPANGFSIGHYEGGSLVAETRYFSEKWGNPFIPGGGYKTEKSKLIQRFTPLEGGKKLKIQFTWTDPTVFEGEHSYEFVYDRSDRDMYAQEFPCDASDPSMGGLATEPPQN